MKKRPLAVTILGCLFIAAGAIALVSHLGDFRASQPFPSDFVLIFAVNLAAMVGGAFLLRGDNWARWLVLAWMAFHVGLSFFHSLREVVVHGLLLVLIACFLFRAEARAYFRHG